MGFLFGPKDNTPKRPIRCDSNRKTSAHPRRRPLIKGTIVPGTENKRHPKVKLVQI